MFNLNILLYVNYCIKLIEVKTLLPFLVISSLIYDSFYFGNLKIVLSLKGIVFSIILFKAYL